MNKPKYKYKYKCRAECLADVMKLSNQSAITNFAVQTHPDFGDVILEFDSPRSISDLRGLLNELPDCHVMAETLELTQNYTGDRK